MEEFRDARSGDAEPPELSRLRSLHETPRPPDDHSEPLDEALVRQFIEGRLDGTTAEYVAWLVSTQLDWSECYEAEQDRRDGIEKRAD